jgi:hypothetical protein
MWKTTLALSALLFSTCPSPSPPPVTCDFSDVGVCGGSCPSGQVCSQRGKTLCACVPEAGSPFCGPNDAGQCAGPCPEGQVCSARGPTVCACVPAAVGN